MCNDPRCPACQAGVRTSAEVAVTEADVLADPDIPRRLARHDALARSRAMDPEVCPDCGMPAESRCRCPLGDRVCANGHHWHQCYRCSAVVRGESDHAHPGANLCQQCRGPAHQAKAPGEKPFPQRRAVYCCHIDKGSGCVRPAVVAVWHGPQPDDFTHSCAVHLADMMDAAVAACGDKAKLRLFLLEPDGTQAGEINLKE